MTAEATRRHVEAEVRRGEEALRAAEALIDLELHNDAMTRIYYAAFHHAVAALLAEGIEPRSHRGLVSLVSQHLVSTGLLEARSSRDLRHLQTFREAADYDSFASFDRESAEAELVKCRGLISAFRAHLAGRGMLPE